jgi:hypothetical protein
MTDTPLSITDVLDRAAIAETLALAEQVREIGDELADALSILNHTVGLRRDTQNALDQWDSLSFKLRAKLRLAASKAREGRGE